MAAEWYYRSMGADVGPFDAATLRTKAVDQIIQPWTPVRKFEGEQWSKWIRAGEVKGLFTRDVSDQLRGDICPTCSTPLKPDGSCPRCDAPFVPERTEIGYASDAPPENDPRILPPRPRERVRYPKLHAYLEFLEVGARICTVLLICLSVLCLWLAADRQSAFILGYSLGCLITAALTYYGTLATVEFIRVIIDIEANTRNAAEKQ
jgi:hypothetical protein